MGSDVDRIKHTPRFLGRQHRRLGFRTEARDGGRELVGRGGDQPDLLAGVEVHLREFAGARPDLVGDDLVVDLLAQRDQLLDGAALDEGERLAPAGGDVVAVFLAEQLELGLGVDESEHVAIGEVAASGQPAAEVHRRGPLHQGVIHVEECGGGQVDRWLRAALRRGVRGAVMRQNLRDGDFPAANVATATMRSQRSW